MLRIRLEVTAPFRCGEVLPWSLLPEAGREAGSPSNDHGNRRP